MRMVSRAARTATVHAAAVAVVLSSPLAACGTAGPAVRLASPAQSLPAAARGAHDLSHGPVAGSRASSLTLARRLLAHLPLPVGARPAGLRRLPGQNGGLWAANRTTADVHRVCWLPLSMPAAAGYLMAHRPSGTRWARHGLEADPSGVTAQTVSYSLRSLPAWVYGAQLVTTVRPGPHGGSVLRADAQVIWYPPRSAAEHLDPAAYDQVTIRAEFMNPKPRSVTRVIRSAALIGRLARLLNGLHATGDMPVMCPAIDADYRLTFVSPNGGVRGVVVDAAGCQTDSVTPVGGRAQPALWDAAERLIALARRMLGIGHMAAGRQRPGKP